METDHQQADGVADRVRPGRFRWRDALIWAVAAPILGGATAWMATVAQMYFAPLIIFPLLVGVLLGAMLVGMARLAQVGHRPTILTGAVLAAALAVVGQHYFQYREAAQRAQEDLEKIREAKQKVPAEWLQGHGPEVPSDFADFMVRQARRGRDLNFGDYVARGWGAWLTWGIDAVLLLAATVAIVLPALWQPYCNECRSWYRVVRSGRIDTPAARRLAEATRVDQGSSPTSARYRLLSCDAGCGPTAFEITWQESEGGTTTVQAWLDHDARQRVTELLDKSRAASNDSAPEDTA